MTDRTPLIRYTEVTDPRLGRHVRHDSRSRAYSIPAHRQAAGYHAVKWSRGAPVFDQGQIGACVANAGVGLLSYERYKATVAAELTFTEATALDYYRKVTRADDYPGSWEPDDTGSDGLSMAGVFKTEQLISGFLHAFGLDDVLAGLMVGPLITGTDWLQDMFDPAVSGRLLVSGALAGGHEYILDEYNPDSGLIGICNSWSGTWGVGGRAYLHRDDYRRLLADRGDATQFVPASDPVPPPGPVVESGLDRLARTTRAWTHREGIACMGATSAKKELRRYLKSQGRF